MNVVGLFGKAKRKLLGRDLEAGLTYVSSGPVSLSSAGDALSSAAVGGIDPALWEPQELGEEYIDITDSAFTPSYF